MTKKYAIVTSGLRGCYMPDSLHVYAFDTRREVKSFLEEEAQQREGCVGLSKAKLAWAAANFWKNKCQDTIIPFALSKGQSMAYCIELSPIDRRDYLNRLKEEED